MCMFSGKVEEVSGTSIFGRVGPGGRQVMAYQMEYKSQEIPAPSDGDGYFDPRGASEEGSQLAMILPIPIDLVEGADQDVHFIDMSSNPDFFGKLSRMFDSTSRSRSLGFSAKGLDVHQVGSFEASYVPSIPDFYRLDKRFRLPEGTWDKLGGYDDFGFVVFKLRAGARKVHPMAFSFPTRWPSKVFFPTLHVHDGEVHDTEMFDHALYAEFLPGDHASTRAFPRRGWSTLLLSKAVAQALDQDALVMRGDSDIARKTIKGEAPNMDVILDLDPFHAI